MKRIVLISLAAVVFGACVEQVPTGTDSGTPSMAISDGVHDAGNPDFFFLPPLVPDPSSSVLFELLEFNANLEPTVGICVLDPAVLEANIDENTDCPAGAQTPGFPIQFTFTSGPGATPELVALAGDHYVVNWHTDEFILDPALFYRISVSVGTLQLAFADVDVANGGRDLHNIDTDEFVALKDGRTLPIKFRIEANAVCIELDPGFVPGDPCATATLGAGESLSLDDNGTTLGIAQVDNGATISMETCTDLRLRGTGLADIIQGRTDLNTFGDCVEIISLELSPAAGIASLCNPFTGTTLTDAQINRMTVHRFGDGDAATFALPHSAGPVCPEVGALELNSLERFVRFARSTWRAVSDQVRAWIEPAPLWAKMAVRCNRGGCSSIDEFRTSFQVAQPAKMAFDPGPTGDLGSALVNTALAAKARLLVTDEGGDPVEDARLTFSVTGGGGLVNGVAGPVVVLSNSSGIAEVTVRVGPNPGLNTWEASGIGIGVGAVQAPLSTDPADAPPVSHSVGTLEFTAKGVVPTTTSLVTSDPLTIFGESVTLTATVSPAPPVSEGAQVEFFDGATSLGTSTADAGGVATLSTSSLSLSEHSLSATFTGTEFFLASTSSAVTHHIIKRFDGLTSFTAALGGAATSTQDFESFTVGTSISTIISGVLNVSSTFDNLQVFGGDKILFGFDGHTRTPAEENGRYDLQFVSPTTRNALAFNVEGQNPLTGAAQVVVTTSVGTVTFFVLNTSTETTPVFLGMVASLPIETVAIKEGLEIGGSGNEEIGLDDFIIAVVILP